MQPSDSGLSDTIFTRVLLAAKCISEQWCHIVNDSELWHNCTTHKHQSAPLSPQCGSNRPLDMIYLILSSQEWL